MTLNERDDGQLRSSQGEYFPEDTNGHSAWPDIRSYVGSLETGKSSLIFWVVALRKLPGPGIKSSSSALASGFLTTRPPGKFPNFF